MMYSENKIIKFKPTINSIIYNFWKAHPIAIEGPHMKYYKAKSGRYNFLFRSLKAKVFLRLTTSTKSL